MVPSTGQSHQPFLQAAMLARKAGAKRLALIHISPLNEGRKKRHLAEAGRVYKGDIVTTDLQKFPL